MRYFDLEMANMVRNRMKDLADGMAKSYGVEIDIENQEVFDVLVNNEDLSHKMLDIASEVVGSENVALRPNVIAGSEDFADMLKVVPGAYCNVGHGGTVPLHNEGFVLDEDILPIGASIYAKIIESRTTV
jgi:hippurate hydrolase